MNKRIISLITLLSIFALLFAGCIEKSNISNSSKADISSTSDNLSNADSDEYGDSLVAVSNTSTATKNYTNSIGMEFVLIPAGEFMMGSPSGEEGRYDTEGPVHEVTIKKAYYLGKYEVTQEQWIAVMGSDPFHDVSDNNPVEMISWYDVQAFIRKLNEMEGTDKYRLPSEAEWEYACRAGTTTKYSFGDSESSLSEYAWWNGNSEKLVYPEDSDEEGYYESTAHPVGRKKPNPWGLYDIHGNVWEWCQDTWHSNYEDAPSDGIAWENGISSVFSSRRVVRGGGWDSDVKDCRSASRASCRSDFRVDSLGFRLLMEVSSLNSDNLSNDISTEINE